MVTPQPGLPKPSGTGQFFSVVLQIFPVFLQFVSSQLPSHRFLAFWKFPGPNFRPRVGLNLSTDATFQQTETLNFPQVLLRSGFGPKQPGGRKILRSRPRNPPPSPRMRSQKMLRSWQNCDFARDILKKCEVLHILRDAILEAKDHYHEQFPYLIGSTTGAPVVNRIFLRSCL